MKYSPLSNATALPADAGSISGAAEGPHPFAEATVAIAETINTKPNTFTVNFNKRFISCLLKKKSDMSSANRLLIKPLNQPLQRENQRPPPL